jgi:hypothetical protein
VTELEAAADEDPELLGLFETDGLVVGETEPFTDLDQLEKGDAVTDILEVLVCITVKLWLTECVPLLLGEPLPLVDPLSVACDTVGKAVAEGELEASAE